MAFIAEIFFQFLFEGLADLGFHQLSGKRRPHPFVSAIGYALLGVAFGAISLSLLDKPFLNEQTWRIATVAITPVILGFAMAYLGNIEPRRERRRFVWRHSSTPTSLPLASS